LSADLLDEDAEVGGRLRAWRISIVVVAAILEEQTITARASPSKKSVASRFPTITANQVKRPMCH
jgi:hypothetical protein